MGGIKEMRATWLAFRIDAPLEGTLYFRECFLAGVAEEHLVRCRASPPLKAVVVVFEFLRVGEFNLCFSCFLTH